MVRASAKNHQDVIIVVNPSQYPGILKALEKDGDISPRKRRELAVEAYQMTSKYDAAIVNYLSKVKA
jgi:phosphoribosylaminoimidazolecarboxamide formyltransferase/IMP cyclohydrolase